MPVSHIGYETSTLSDAMAVQSAAIRHQFDFRNIPQELLFTGLVSFHFTDLSFNCFYRHPCPTEAIRNAEFQPAPTVGQDRLLSKS